MAAASGDSPLSIAASVAGLLTLAFAVGAAVYVRLQYMRGASAEYFRLKTSLSWYKTESTWMLDLVNAADRRKQAPPSLYDGGGGGAGTASDDIHAHARAYGQGEMEFQMYVFVLDQIGKLEERLLDLLADVELQAAQRPAWTLVPERWGLGQSGIAMAWLQVRTKALDLARQRDALGQRVLFAQMAMVSSRVSDLERRERRRRQEESQRLDRLEKIILSQQRSLDNVKDTILFSARDARRRSGIV